MTYQRGFSLFELLCVLFVLSILAQAGVSHFIRVNQDTQDKNTLQQQVKYLADALSQARQIAVMSGKPSFLCGGVECNGDWSTGFRLYQLEPFGESKNPLQHRIFDALLSVSWRGFPVQKHHIEFLPHGLSGYQNGTFVFCLGSWRADIVLNQSGRFYITDPQRQGAVAC